MKIDELKRLIREDLERIARDRSTIESVKKNYQTNRRPAGKDLKRSELARAEGNELYGRVKDQSSDYDRILYLYNESIAFAPLGSAELAAAYGNKSALLRRLLKFKHCVTETDKALSITQSIPLKVKLLCRKAECLTALHSSENGKCIQKAQFLLQKLEDLDEVKETLRKLIKKAQLFIDDPNSENYREEKLREKAYDKVEKQSLKFIGNAEKTTSIQDSFRMEYSKKYGHHLVAARDFKPGEIMCVEKPYHIQIIDFKTPSYCFQCGHFLWTIVPCDHCSWYVYCSEQCKVEAWNEHHDIGCGALQHLKKMLPFHEAVDYTPDALFYKALKEAGSISRLRADIESMDKDEDHSGKILTSGRKFDSYKSLYLTPLSCFPRTKLDDCVRTACFGLIGLAQPILNMTPDDRAHDPLNLRKLKKNETALFMAALLCKFSMINLSKTKGAKLFDPAPDGSDANLPMARTLVLTSILTPIGCVPNIGHCPTVDNKFFMYAMEPIKAGSQLFSSLVSSSIYNEVPKAMRQFFHSVFYQEPCLCRACTEDWDQIWTGTSEASSIPSHKYDKWEELIEEISAIRTETDDQIFLRELNLVDFRYVDRVRKLAAGAWQNFPLPSQVTFYAVKFMIELFETFFSPNIRRSKRSSDDSH